MKTVRYGVKWFDGVQWVGPFASLTARQASKVAKDLATRTAAKIVEIK